MFKIFPNIYKATFGYNWLTIRDCIFLIRFNWTYSLFLTAVILFYFTICSPLPTVPWKGSYRCYHYVIQSRAFSVFYCSPVRVAISPDESLLLVGWNIGSFSKFYNSWAKTFVTQTNVYHSNVAWTSGVDYTDSSYWIFRASTSCS